MYEVNDIKYVVNETEPAYCVACLSSNRKLTSVEQMDEYTDILRTISTNSIKMYTKLLLCWECVAMLSRIKLFKLRIEQAQRQLATHFAQKQVIRSLSRLTTTTNDNIIFITHMDDDSGDNKQTLIAIKQEINNFDDDCNFDQGDAPDDHCLEEIKKETKPQIKCVKRNKVTHYKIVYGQNVYKKSSIRKKFSIKEEEVALWLEREKDSKFYKSFKYRCKMCFHGYNCKKKLKMHHMECHDMSLGEYVCRWCAARFATAVNLSAHAHAHTFARACARCGFQCYSARRLNAHLDTHRLVKCVYCELCVPDVRAFNQHYKALHGVFLCDHCGKRCRTKYMLEKHMARHTTSHRCSECARQYRSRAALNKHRALKHSAAAPEDAYCVRCDKQFDSAPVYRRHVQNTSAHAHETRKLVKKVECPECGNTYSRRAYMMNHYRHVHMNQSRHYCAPCDRHFLNRTRYVDHMRFNHEGVKREKNKLCNVCGRGFATNRILLNHIRTHSGERPFECECCGAKFTQKHSMLSHVKHVHLRSQRRAAWHH